MKTKSKTRKIIIVSILSTLVLILFWVVFALFRINYYLNQYGYGSEALPKVAAVYFHSSDGVTIIDVNENNVSTFVARNPKEIFERNGYYEAGRWGTFAMYNKSGSEYDSGDFEVNDTDDWCFWFRMYQIDNGKRIEDFLYTQSQKDLPFKVSLKPLQRLAVSKGRAFGRSSQRAKHPLLQPFARGEFQNSPVDCFERGDALAESVPLNRH